MDNKLMIGCLEGMIDTMARRWEGELEETEDTQFALVYAQLCAALAAINAPKPFLQIGEAIICKADIIKLEIKEANSLYSYKHLYLYTRNFEGGEGYGPSSEHAVYDYHSPEGQTLLEWLQGQSEVLMPYADPVHIQPDYEESVNREFQKDEEAYLVEVDLPY